MGLCGGWTTPMHDVDDADAAAGQVEAACEQRDQRIGAHVHAVRADRKIHAACIPEARLGVDVLVIGRVDEHRHVDRLAVGRKVVRDDLANRQIDPFGIS